MTNGESSKTVEKGDQLLYDNFIEMRGKVSEIGPFY